MRKSYVQVDGVLYEKGTEPMSDAPLVMGDIKPYKSMIDGTLIEGRAQHREHLRRHGCVELGNDVPMKQGIPDASPQKRKELIRAQIDAMPHRVFRQAIKRDADRVKWNSRED